jgi:tetrahydromethanopterin S-methyltransferase subunit E
VKPITFISLGALGLAVWPAAAATLLDVSSSLALTDPTQLGRISRNGTAAVWSAAKAFPGVISSGVPYHYQSFTVPAAAVALAPYLQITLVDPDAAVLVAAYDNAYTPGVSLSTNYAGDAGSTSQFGNPTFLQVTVPAGHDLVVVVSDVLSGNGGIGRPFRVMVEGFLDTQFTEPPGPRITAASLSGTNLVLSGTNELDSGIYWVVTSTNLAQPEFTWKPIWTNALGQNTNFTFTATNGVPAPSRQRFYGLESQ